jgi:hypothetical protein
MIRQIKRAEDKQITFELPEEYIGQEIEVLIFPISEAVEPLKKERQTFSAVEIETKNLKFNREEANER